jgi:hypothetical protein
VGWRSVWWQNAPLRLFPPKVGNFPPVLANPPPKPLSLKLIVDVHADVDMKVRRRQW